MNTCKNLYYPKDAPRIIYNPQDAQRIMLIVVDADPFPLIQAEFFPNKKAEYLIFKQYHTLYLSH